MATRCEKTSHDRRGTSHDEAPGGRAHPNWNGISYADPYVTPAHGILPRFARWRPAKKAYTRGLSPSRQRRTSSPGALIGQRTSFCSSCGRWGVTLVELQRSMPTAACVLPIPDLTG